MVTLVGVVYGIRSYGLNKIRKAAESATKTKKAAAAVLTGLYTVSPLDFILDVLVPLGFLDDLALMGICVFHLFSSGAAAPSRPRS